MDKELSLEERVLRSIMEPSQPRVEKGQRGIQQETPKSKEASSANQLHPGVWIEFHLPLFGLCTARIHEVAVDGCIITNHSVLKGEGEPVTIPASWIVGTYLEKSK
jgi:hypothetical protein